jgi:hypothetical protein
MAEEPDRAESAAKREDFEPEAEGGASETARDAVYRETTLPPL